MASVSKEVKLRYFRRIYRQAPFVQCACGCGKKVKNRDKYGRPREFLNGHNGRKYADPTQYKREWNHRNRKSRQRYKAFYHRKRKVDCIIYKGGKCNDCSLRYDGTNAAIFHFHHKNPKRKDFAVGNQVINKAWDVILKELDKCVLLCANCHELRHSISF